MQLSLELHLLNHAERNDAAFQSIRHFHLLIVLLLHQFIYGFYLAHGTDAFFLKGLDVDDDRLPVVCQSLINGVAVDERNRVEAAEYIGRNLVLCLQFTHFRYMVY